MSSWPELDHARIRPTLDHLHRISQIAGKYTLDQPFDPSWGNVVFSVTPRGFATPLLHAGEVSFAVDYELLDDRVTVEASTGRVSIPLEAGSVAGFYARYLAAVEPLGVPGPRTLSQPEIPGAPPIDEDTEARPWDSAVARDIWAALASSSDAFTAWQSPFKGYRPRVGIMWGAFDLSASRYTGRQFNPPPDHPMFQRNGMCSEVVSLGLFFGDPSIPEPYFFAYIAPPPDGLERFDFELAGAEWRADVGLIVLPWSDVVATSDPHATVIRFGDRVYQAAVELAGWPDDLVAERVDGWYASRHPTFA
jgi:Family of unknown function (DUF5996)